GHGNVSSTPRSQVPSPGKRPSPGPTAAAVNRSTRSAKTRALSPANLPSPSSGHPHTSASVTLAARIGSCPAGTATVESPAPMRRPAIPARTAAPSIPREPPTTSRCRSEEHTSELQSREKLVCRLLLEKKNKDINPYRIFKFQ